MNKTLIITSKLGILYANQTLEEGSKPMSPEQIRVKYSLSFPFTVRRVVDWPYDSKCDCFKHLLKSNAIITFSGQANNDKKSYIVDVPVCRHNYRKSILSNSERFVYFDGGIK